MKDKKKETKPKRVAGEMRIYVEEDGELFPFSMSIEQFLNSEKAKQERQKSQKQKKEKL